MTTMMAAVLGGVVVLAVGVALVALRLGVMASEQAKYATDYALRALSENECRSTLLKVNPPVPAIIAHCASCGASAELCGADWIRIDAIQSDAVVKQAVFTLANETADEVGRLRRRIAELEADKAVKMDKEKAFDTIRETLMKRVGGEG